MTKVSQQIEFEFSQEAGIPFSDYLSLQKNKVDQALRAAFADSLNLVEQAASYSLFLPSKRLRPILCLEVAKAFGCDEAAAMPAAIALEMLHTYSLIHDDLPSMDNDDLRRGQPTNHKKFGEASAILAGDGLLTKAFEVLSTCEKIDAHVRIHWVKELSLAAGMRGMVLGQEEDLKMSEASSVADLEKLHRNKTGALIAASAVMGGIAAKASEESLKALQSYSLEMGLAFQIRDDVLDVEGGDEIGKPIKSDERNSKSTYVSILGLDEAKRQAETWYQKSLQSLACVPFSRSHRLSELTEFVVRRKL